MTRFTRWEWRMLYGFGVLVIIAFLCAIIALGKVEEKTSFGLNYLLGALSTMAGGFTQWAFTADRHGDKDAPTTSKTQ